MNTAGGTAARLARILLLLYPRAFRQEAGPEVVEAHRLRSAARLREHGRLAWAAWLVRAGAAMVASAPGAWRERDGGGTAWDAEGHRRLHRGRELMLGRNLRHAARGLLRTPGFTLVVLLTLALGIGGTTAIFTVVRAVLVEPLPYPESEALVRFYQYDIEDPTAYGSVTQPHFLHYREHAGSFADVATVYSYDETGADLMVGGQAERIRVLRVSGDYFDVLGVAPSAGRGFTRADETPAPVVVLSARLRRRLGTGGSPGASVEMDGQKRTVVGIMPADLEDPLVGAVDAWTPEDLVREQSPGNHYLGMIGRLRGGVTPAAARAEMASLDRALAERFPNAADDTHFHLRPLHEDVVRAARPGLLLLAGAVGIVLLIAVVNVANLQMVRALGRRREMAVRAALGAGRVRIAGQLMTESLLLAAVGGAAGLGVAVLGVRGLLALGGGALPRASEVGVDPAVLAFAAAVTLLAGTAFGLAPALRLGGTRPGAALREGGRGSSTGRGYARVRSFLVAGQVALAVMLLSGAAVLGASMHRLLDVDLGISDDAVLTFELNLPAARYDGPARAAFHRRMTERLAALPGVRTAGATSWLPATGMSYNWGTFPLTGPLAGDEPSFFPVDQRVVAGDYFGVVGIELLEGRFFDARDVVSPDTVAVLSRATAEALFPGTSALGQRTRGGGQNRTVIGVVSDVARDTEGEPMPHLYHLHDEFAGRFWTMNYLVGTEGEDPMALLPAVRREIAAADPLLVVHQPTPLADVLGRGRSQRSFAFVLTAVFAGLALSLALLGLYGVLSYAVGQRRRELGIRLALGARGGQVAGLVVRQGLALTAGGLVLGLAGSLALGRVLAALVYRTSPGDPRLLAAAAGVLALAAVAACLLPALRAAQTEVRAVLDA